MGVSYREIPPAAALTPFVESFWLLDADHAGEAGPAQRVVPDGHPELILNLAAPFEYFENGTWHRQPRIFFAGQIRGPLLLRPSGRARILGVRFTPHGAAAILDPPMHQLAGRFTPIDDFSPALHRALDRALNSPNPIPAVETALLHAHRESDALLTYAVREVTRTWGALDLAVLAGDLGLGVRQLERRFNSHVGLAPKLFCRMQRFVQVFRALEGENRRWVEIAAACGYYDQAHLIRDFKDLAGETPVALLAPDADLARHFLPHP
jgi:AraC-like DNA-binding protein